MNALTISALTKLPLKAFSVSQSVPRAVENGLCNHRLILCEGGPTVLGALVADGLVDELFLTISPLLAGRRRQDSRPALIENAGFLPDLRVAGRLLSLRRSFSPVTGRWSPASGSRRPPRCRCARAARAPSP